MPCSDAQWCYADGLDLIHGAVLSTTTTAQPCAAQATLQISAHMRSGVVPMGLTSSMGLLRMKSAQCLGIRLASVTASLFSSRATWQQQQQQQYSECEG
jgi:hypothetical protein